LVATNIDLLRLCLTAQDAAGCSRVLKDSAGRAFHALSLKGTPIGDTIEDELGRPGRAPRAGARLVWFVARLLEQIHLDESPQAVAQDLARWLDGANGIEEISPSSDSRWPSREAQARIDGWAKVIEQLLKKWVRDSGRSFPDLADNDRAREDVARRIVATVARMSGYRDPQARLFGAAAKKSRRARRKLVP